MKTYIFKLLLLIVVLVLSIDDTLAQVSWTKYEGNPIITGGPSGSWNHHVLTSSVLYNSDSLRYEMWFTASPYDAEPLRIGFAKSIDGIIWTMHPDPVLWPTPGTWDQNTVEFPCVIREDGQYKMWYAGASQYLVYKVGYATSPDGIVWTKDTVHNPIFGPGTAFWEAGGIHGRCVMPVAEGGYKIWYEGYEGPPNYYSKIGYATSEDGINWIRDTLHNPILGPGDPGEWDDSYIFMPDVLYISGSYYMYYGGAKPGLMARQIGLATSPDGINWTKDTVHNPVLPRGNPGEWDADLVQMGRLLLVGDSLYMWYTGDPIAPHLWKIGLATSPFIPVPVELTSFIATSNGNKVILNWSTATELNNLGFDIERASSKTSPRQEDWEKIGFVPGYGTTTEPKSYSYSDESVNSGTNYYRLRQVDFNGSYEYSDVLEVEWRAFNYYLLEQNYPNPYNPTTTIGFGLQNKSNVKITILNLIGEEVAVVLNEERESGFHQVEFNAANLPSGVYFYQLRAGDFVETKKMVLMK